MIRDIKDYYYIHSFTIGGGEPFLRDDVMDFVTVFKEEVPSASIGITSNGTLINKDWLSRLKGLVDTVQISVDGSTPAVHDKIRNCKGSFAMAEEAIRLCRKYDFKVSVRTTLMSLNLQDVPAIIDLLPKWGVRLFGIRRILPQGKALTAWDELSPSPEEYINELRLIKDKLSKIEPKIYFWGGDPIINIICFEKSVFRATTSKVQDMKAYFKDPKNRFKWYSGCAAGVSYIYIAANGDFCLCPMLPTPIGNALENNLLTLLQSPIISRIKIRSFNGKCGQCEAKYLCGGCRASAFFSNGDLLGEDPACPLEYGYDLAQLERLLLWKI